MTCPISDLQSILKDCVDEWHDRQMEQKGQVLDAAAHFASGYASVDATIDFSFSLKVIIYINTYSRFS